MREWKRSASQESRRLRTEARRARERVREARQREAAARTAARDAALARRPESSAQVVDRLLKGAPDDEAFWQTVLAWCGDNPMLPRQELGPLVDFIAHRRAEVPGFSMKGRSALALLRGMRTWHGNLALARDYAGRVFKPSGFQPVDIDRSRRDRLGRRILEVWHVREILDGKALADEGRAMGHCVYSYTRLIEAGHCAIWTLTLRDDTGHWRRLTIEIHVAQRQIVQARGRFNARADPRDLLVLEQWAVMNRLTVALGRW